MNPPSSQEVEAESPAHVANRVSKALWERFILVNRIRKSNIEEEFFVIDSSGNLYKVTMSTTPKCTCQDFIFHRKLCKHLYFLMVRLFGVSIYNISHTSHSFSENEVLSLLNKQTIATPYVETSESLKNVLNAFKQSVPFESVNSTSIDANGIERSMHGVARRPFENESCAICYEPMKSEEPLVWCQLSCGTNVHNECFILWNQSETRASSSLKCAYCGAPWTQEPHSPVTKIDGYYNFSPYF